MKIAAKNVCALEVAWYFLTLLSATLILAIVFGGAAFSGINLAMEVYLSLSLICWIGLILGAFMFFSGKRFYLWISGLSSAILAGLSLFFLCWLLYQLSFRRPKPANELWVAGVHTSLTAIYVCSSLLCAGEVWLCILRARRLQSNPVVPGQNHAEI